jgi:uncharacterized protein (TIGR02147 family)
MPEPQSPMPNLLEYLDVLKFLQDYFSWRKAHENGFSFETWAAELGFRSRSYLRMVLIGKKPVSEQFAQCFCRAGKLTIKEMAYFQILFKYSQAGKQIEKKFYGQQLIQILKDCSEREVIRDAIDFLSSPLYARLLVMLGFSDITPTAKTFARLLSTTEVEMSEALKKLNNLRLASSVKVDEELHWSTSHTNFDVPDDIGSVPLMRFHEVSLNDSIKAFHQPKDLRRYKSLLLPLTQEELQEFHLAVEDFASQQLVRFQAKTYSGRRLFQVNLNIFSIAEPSQEEHRPKNRTLPAPEKL